jgi:hypothetical protein
MNGIAITELQADKIRTIIHGKEQPIWIFAHDRGLVSALASDSRGKTKLSKHTLRLPGYLQPNESRTCPSGCHGGFVFLCEGHPPRHHSSNPWRRPRVLRKVW